MEDDVAEETVEAAGGGTGDTEDLGDLDLAAPPAADLMDSKYLEAYDCISLALEAIRLRDDLEDDEAESSSLVELRRQLDEPVDEVKDMEGNTEEAAEDLAGDGLLYLYLRLAPLL